MPSNESRVRAHPEIERCARTFSSRVLQSTFGTNRMTLVLLLVACGGNGSGGGTTIPADSQVPEGVVLHWGVSQGLWGAEVLEVKADGEVTLHFDPADPAQETVDGSFDLTPEEMETLRRTLEEHDVCDIESGRDGIPDEGHPGLNVSWGSIQCRVSAWDGEWDEDAPEILAAINELRRRATAAD